MSFFASFASSFSTGTPRGKADGRRANVTRCADAVAAAAMRRRRLLPLVVLLPTVELVLDEADEEDAAGRALNEDEGGEGEAERERRRSSRERERAGEPEDERDGDAGRERPPPLVEARADEALLRLGGDLLPPEVLFGLRPLPAPPPRGDWARVPNEADRTPYNEMGETYDAGDSKDECDAAHSCTASERTPTQRNAMQLTCSRV